jgi:hypothetical protein
MKKNTHVCAFPFSHLIAFSSRRPFRFPWFSIPLIVTLLGGKKKREVGISREKRSLMVYRKIH